MPAGEERDEDLIDDRILPDDDLADLGQDALAAERDALGDRRNVSRSRLCRRGRWPGGRLRIHL